MSTFTCKNMQPHIQATQDAAGHETVSMHYLRPCPGHRGDRNLFSNLTKDQILVLHSQTQLVLSPPNVPIQKPARGLQTASGKTKPMLTSPFTPPSPTRVVYSRYNQRRRLDGNDRSP